MIRLALVDVATFTDEAIVIDDSFEHASRGLVVWFDPERAYAHFLLAGAAAEADREALAGSLSPDAIARARSLAPSLRTRAASP